MVCCFNSKIQFDWIDLRGVFCSPVNLTVWMKPDIREQHRWLWDSCISASHSQIYQCPSQVWGAVTLLRAASPCCWKSSAAARVQNSSQGKAAPAWSFLSGQRPRVPPLNHQHQEDVALLSYKTSPPFPSAGDHRRFPSLRMFLKTPQAVRYHKLTSQSDGPDKWWIIGCWRHGSERFCRVRKRLLCWQQRWE